MTFVGKILVIVIMAFSLLFLGISTVVFTTDTNWKDATAKEKAKVADVQKKLTDAKASVDAVSKDLASAKSAHDAAKKLYEEKVASLDSDIKRAQDEITQVRGQLEVSTQSAKTALDEVTARKQETDTLREQKSAVEKQANEFKLRQSELSDQIRILARERDVAKDNNKDLRDRYAKVSELLRRNGLSDDISQVKGLESPPVVEGEVVRVDQKNKRLEISIGSDDGLVPGHELYVYRTKPRAEYLGKIQIMSTDPDQAVGKVIGTTVQGKKIQEGDIVSSTIRPRS